MSRTSDVRLFFRIHVFVPKYDTMRESDSIEHTGMVNSVGHFCYIAII